MQITPFVQLLRIALGKFPADGFTACSEEEWDAIFEAAKRQAVIGLLYKGMMSLPESLRPSRRTKVKIAIMTEKIQQNNARMTQCVSSLYSDLCSLGLPSCLLKGQGTALLYDDPSLRQSGDIDMWVGGEKRTVLEKLSEKWETGSVFYHHVDVKVFGKSPEVEIHFTPSWMNNPFVNRRLQKYFKAQEAFQLQTDSNGENFPLPSTVFNLVFNMVHLYRHLLMEGIGIRQFVDYYYILLHSDAAQRREAADLIASFRMERFASATVHVLHELFDMPEEYDIVEPSEKYGSQLLSEIRKGGNFGQYDDRNRDLYKNAAPVRFLRKMSRLMTFTFAYPSEVLWAPYFKIMQYLFISVRRS